MPTTLAKSSFSPQSPRKINLVASSIRGKSVDRALVHLQFSPRRAASYLAKVLRQAIANAKSDPKQNNSNLIVSEAYATKGANNKKIRFAGRGRRRLYERPTSHIVIKLKDQSTKK